jgi:hypothetical protein
MSRRLKGVLEDSKDYNLDNNSEAISESKYASRRRDLIKNAEDDLKKAEANKMAAAYGYSEPNKYSWQQGKGRKRTRRNRSKKSRSKRSRSKRYGRR